MKLLQYCKDIFIGKIFKTLVETATSFYYVFLMKGIFTFTKYCRILGEFCIKCNSACCKQEEILDKYFFLFFSILPNYQRREKCGQHWLLLLDYMGSFHCIYCFWKKAEVINKIKWMFAHAQQHHTNMYGYQLLYLGMLTVSICLPIWNILGLGLQQSPYKTKHICVQTRELQISHVDHFWPMSKTDEIYTIKVEISLFMSEILDSKSLWKYCHIWKKLHTHQMLEVYKFIFIGMNRAKQSVLYN